MGHRPVWPFYLGNQMDGIKEYLNTYECAELMGRSPGAIRNLVMRRSIPFRKVSGRLMFLRSELERWIQYSPGLSFEDFEQMKSK
jgi:hypothetical protein